jgi:hypothetical protein
MHVSFDEVDSLCVPTKEGMSMLGLEESAQSIGFDCSAFKAPLAIFSHIHKKVLYLARSLTTRKAFNEIWEAMDDLGFPYYV